MFLGVYWNRPVRVAVSPFVRNSVCVQNTSTTPPTIPIFKDPKEKGFGKYDGKRRKYWLRVCPCIGLCT